MFLIPDGKGPLSRREGRGGKGTVNEHLRIARGAVLFHRGRRTDAKTGPMAAIARLVESYVLDVYFCC